MSAAELPACVHGVVQWALAVLPCEPIQTMCSAVASARDPCCQRQRHHSTHAFRRANACPMRICCQYSVNFSRCPIREPLWFNRLHMCILGAWDEYSAICTRMTVRALTQRGIRRPALPEPQPSSKVRTKQSNTNI